MFDLGRGVEAFVEFSLVNPAANSRYPSQYGLSALKYS